MVYGITDTAPCMLCLDLLSVVVCAPGSRQIQGTGCRARTIPDAMHIGSKAEMWLSPGNVAAEPVHRKRGLICHNLTLEFFPEVDLRIVLAPAQVLLRQQSLAISKRRLEPGYTR